MADAPPTQRSRTTCECSIYRHQLQLADHLAKHIEPIVADIKALCKANRVNPCEKDQALIDAFDLYGQARVLAETGKVSY